MPTAIYLRRGTPLKINNDGGAYAWTVEGLASNAGRVSAQIDWGSGAIPDEFEWSGKVQWQASPVQGQGLDFYYANAVGVSTQIDGDVGASNAALGDVDQLRNLRYFGSVVAEEADTTVMVASGRFRNPSRYMSLVAHNDGGAAINATASNFVFYLTPIYYEAQ
jgi:hypothetical protein